MRGAKTGLLIAACAFGCGGEVVSFDRVIARVGSNAVTVPVVEARPRKLDTRTRNAVSASSFELRAPKGTRRLAWSTACASGPGPARSEEQTTAGGARFRIEQRGASGPWEPLFEGETAADESWQDHEATLSGESKELRFAIDPGASCDGLWGSPLLLGRVEDDERPNVVLVTLDTLGAAYLGAFSGEKGVSPHLDAFLEDGASFRRAYAQYGNTLVSHASLFSALHPRRHGVYSDAVPGPLTVSLVPAFSDAGYRTVAFTEGAFVSAAFGFAVGFDAYDDGMTGLSEQMAGGAAETFERALGWIANTARHDRFFLFLHTYEVHSPYLPRDDAALAVAAQRTPNDERIFPRELQGLSMLRHNSGKAAIPGRDLARMAALHVGEIHGLDAIAGRFLRRLEAMGLADDTLVVITADHGDQFGEGGKVGHGDSLHNRVLHVPLGFRWPGRIEQRRIEAPVQLVDVLPTLLDLAGLPVPGDLDGASLAPALTQGGEDPERAAFSEQRSGRGECARIGEASGCRLDRLAVQTARFKLVESRLPTWRRLYDLANDPDEERDAASEHPQEAARLSALLEEYRTGPSADAPSGPGVIDADTLRRLRELGYAEPKHQRF